MVGQPYGGVVGSVLLTFGVAPVEELVGSEFGIEGEAGELAIGGDDAELAGSSGDEHVAVGAEGETLWGVEAFGDGDNFKGDVELLLGGLG